VCVLRSTASAVAILFRNTSSQQQQQRHTHHTTTIRTHTHSTHPVALYSSHHVPIITAQQTERVASDVVRTPVVIARSSTHPIQTHIHTHTSVPVSATERTVVSVSDKTKMVKQQRMKKLDSVGSSDDKTHIGIQHSPQAYTHVQAHGSDKSMDAIRAVQLELERTRRGEFDELLQLKVDQRQQQEVQF